MGRKWTAIEIDRLMKDYEQSGVPRRQLCQRIGMPVSTFDYHRSRWLERKREQQRRPQPTQPGSRHRFVKVELSAPAQPEPKQKPETAKVSAAAAGLAILVGNGQQRRIEIDSIRNFTDEDLARLIRIVESA